MADGVVLADAHRVVDRHRAVIGAGDGHRQRGAVGAAVAVIHRCRRRSSVDGLAGGQRSRSRRVAVVDGIAVAAIGVRPSPSS